MWQGNNDRYHLWSLEHQLPRNKLDRLLNSITETDRQPLFRIRIAPLGTALRRAFKLLCGVPAALQWARRIPAHGGGHADIGQGTSR